MVQVHSGITWFEDDDWVGSEIVFKSPTVSKWRVTRKIAEHEECVGQMEVEMWKMESSCRAVFACSSLDHPGKEAAVKIRMQIPYNKSAHRRPHVRAKQALPEMPYTTEDEIKGLQHVTAARCSSAPALFAWKHETQGDDGWVPGGYIDYILMELVPGSSAASEYNQMEREERDELREALKKAWLDCAACGFINRDPAIRNVVWDRKTQKCYIVDWEDWRESTPDDVWTNTRWIDWNMAWCRNGNYKDMSTWVL